MTKRQGVLPFLCWGKWKLLPWHTDSMLFAVRSCCGKLHA